MARSPRDHLCKRLGHLHVHHDHRELPFSGEFHRSRAGLCAYELQFEPFEDDLKGSSG